MTLDVKQKCAVCAWREACTKKYTIKESALHCPDFSRDLNFAGEGEEVPPAAAGRHKHVEDVFGDS